MLNTHKHFQTYSTLKKQKKKSENQFFFSSFSKNFTDTDTDFSESEALSSLQISGPAKLGDSRKEPTFVRDILLIENNTNNHIYFSEPQVHRIETKQAPVPSQPEVVLSDGKNGQIFLLTCCRNTREIAVV